MRAITCLTLLAGLSAAWSQDAAAIMRQVAENLDKSVDARRQYVYTQNVTTRFLRTNGKVARQEKRVYESVPQTDRTEKKLLSLAGEIHKGKDVVRYTETGKRSGNMDLDGEMIENLTSDLVDNKHSRDGIPKSLFPFRKEALPLYKFTLVKTEDYKGRRTHRIAFEPAKKPDCIEIGSDDETDDGCENAIWKGEALIDAEELQPVHLATDLALKIPFLVRTVFGTNLKQTGFAVTYTRVAENVWFPVSYGTEFRFNLLFGYKRVITMALDSTGFQKAGAESKIEFSTAN